jgi:hypothetical protein
MINFKNKIQNICNNLSSLLVRLRKINVLSLAQLPYHINTIASGSNKLGLCLLHNIQDVTENDFFCITTIGAYAFEGCINLTSVTIPDSITSIGEGAFFNCSNLTEITLPDGIKLIESDTFRGCRSLTSVNIPASVIYIGSYAFYDCTHCKDMYFNSPDPPILYFYTSLYDVARIHVPIGSGDAYKNGTNWSSLASRIVEDIEI